ncbi:MAG: HAMP domain-containing sensor histidine kinase [Fulvivirga sp.]|uniref:sensor histidine kinase n=1 Tax=Fulvivirga sp. TaxID=1931237 RepID=UPI0032EE5F0B
MPALFFSAYEIASLNQDEEEINKIYEQQLEAFLFSANQYADDVLNTWVTKLEVGMRLHEVDTTSNEVKKLLDLNPSINALIAYYINDKAATIYPRDTSIVQYMNGLNKLLADNRDIGKRLIKYSKSGFQKVEPISFNTTKELVVFLFHPGTNNEDNLLYGIVVDPILFIEDVLGPRLQFIAKNRFALQASKLNEPYPIYSTFDSTNVESIKPILNKDLWLLPDYKLGISTRGDSIQTLIKERTYTNLGLILALDVFLILGVVLVFRNVKKEVELAQNKSEFISNVSHEIRTPLALISMFAETLELGRVPTEEKKKEYYSIINKETQRLTGIVNKILSFSQMDAGKKRLSFESVNLKQVVENVLTTYEYHLEKEQFKIQTELAEANINGDKDALTELLINLIDNAIKYSDESKRIEINLLKKEGKTMLAVKDYGVGISKTDQKYIFDKFFRVSTGDLAKKQGTGLGLALVKQIVDAHNATIELKSDLGKGSTFIVSFPLEKVNNG